jgi:hypothetical protein
MDTTYKPGDYEHAILRKWLVKLGGDFQLRDSLNDLLRKILAQIPGSKVFQLGDSNYDLLRKILINSGGSWSPADLKYHLWRKILEQQPAGTPENEFQFGDLKTTIQRKILERTP